MTRDPALPPRPARLAPVAPRASAAAGTPDAALPRTPVLQRARAPRQLSFAFHRA